MWCRRVPRSRLTLDFQHDNKRHTPPDAGGASGRTVDGGRGVGTGWVLDAGVWSMTTLERTRFIHVRTALSKMGPVSGSKTKVPLRKKNSLIVFPLKFKKKFRSSRYIFCKVLK